MGKGAIYVFFILVVIAVIIAIAIGVTRLITHLVKQHFENELENKRLTTPWISYLTVNKSGAVTIGVRRSAMVNDKFHIFEGPIVLHELAADHHPIDVQLKVQDAKDRASLYNTLAAEKEANER